MSREQAETKYEALNTELVRAMGRLSAAVEARETNAVDVEDKEIRRILAEMRAMLRCGLPSAGGMSH